MNITGGKYNSLKVKAPDSDFVRPTLSKIRASVFNVLLNMIDFETSKFLDAFCGSGIISLEAISRGFKEVLSVEKDIKTAKIIKENFKSIKLEPNLIVKDAIKLLETTDETFDVIYLDPPYEKQDLYQKSLDMIVKRNLLNQTGVVVLECEKDLRTFSVPKPLTLLKEKTYGNTMVMFYTLS